VYYSVCCPEGDQSLPWPAFRQKDRRIRFLTLYFVQARPSNLIKVGITQYWDNRLSAIRRGNSEHVEVLKIFHGSDDEIRELEKELHLELAGSNDHHEWFQLSDSELQAVLDRLERQFNPESCPV
jgi:hypothetical protein